MPGSSRAVYALDVAELFQAPDALVAGCCREVNFFRQRHVRNPSILLQMLKDQPVGSVEHVCFP